MNTKNVSEVSNNIQSKGDQHKDCLLLASIALRGYQLEGDALEAATLTVARAFGSEIQRAGLQGKVTYGKYNSKKGEFATVGEASKARNFVCVGPVTKLHGICSRIRDLESEFSGSKENEGLAFNAVQFGIKQDEWLDKLVLKAMEDSKPADENKSQEPESQEPTEEPEGNDSQENKSQEPVSQESQPEQETNQA
jgi:hypothetical protein